MEAIMEQLQPILCCMKVTLIGNYAQTQFYIFTQIP